MKQKTIFLLLSIPLLLITLFLHLYKVEPFESFSLKFNDLNFVHQEKKVSEDIVFVSIDEKSINRYGRWPWDREIIAQGVKHLADADLVLFDMIFSEHTQSQKDQKLASSIAGLNKSVCGFFLRHEATQEIEEESLALLSDSSLDLLQSQLGSSSSFSFVGAKHAEINIFPILQACGMSGSFSTLAASDHLFRSYPLAFYYQNLLYPSLGLQALRLHFDADIEKKKETELEIASYRLRVDQQGFVRLNYYERDQYKTLSFADLLTQKVDPLFFKGKIVIIGVTDLGSGDVVSTPMGPLPGGFLHYTFLSNILEGHLIREIPFVTQLLLVFMVLLPSLAFVISPKILLRVLIYIVVYGVAYLGSRFLFIEHMLYIDLFYPLLALILSVALFEIVAFYQKEKGERFLRDAFSSYLSADLLDQLIKNPQALSLGGESKELSILFSDIRSFTTISESMTPQDLIKLLNRYFTPMTDAVLKNKGMLDKYIGDAVMAFFNAPVDIQDHADASCSCALEMMEALDLLNSTLVEEGKAPIHIGIGINTAEVVVGNMGSDTRFNYTAIGDGVNLASRLEGLTKNYGVDILISEFTVLKLTKAFIYRKIEPVIVKGKKRDLLIYELMPYTKKSKEIKKVYDKALQNYIQGEIEEAKRGFEHLLQRYEDPLAGYFLNNIASNRPWGIHAMKTK